MAWIKVPRKSYDGVPQGYVVHSGKEYIKALRDTEVKTATKTQVSSQPITNVRVKPNEINVKDFKNKRRIVNA